MAQTKLVLAKWIILAIAMLYISPYLSSWIGGYLSIIGTVGSHLARILTYLIFLWFGDFILNQIFGLN